MRCVTLTDGKFCILALIGSLKRQHNILFSDTCCNQPGGDTIFRAIVLCESDLLEIQDFPQIASLVDGYEIIVPPAPTMVRKPAAPVGPAMTGGTQSVGRSAGHQVSDGMALGIPAVTDGGHIRKLDEVEADMIRLALNRYRGQMSEVARKLGIGRSTLYRKMRDLGLDEATG